MVTKEFLTAGRATFTVTSPNGSNTHETYRIRLNRKNGRYNVLALRNGYEYLGRLNAESGAVEITPKSAFTADDLTVKVLRWALLFPFREHAMPDGYDILHDGACGRCGRQLTDPISISRGIGPECIKIMGGERVAA